MRSTRVLQTGGRALGRLVVTTLILASFVSIGRGQVLDTTFDPNPSATVSALAVQPDGKIIVAGGFEEIASSKARPYVARLNANGSLDTTFALQVNAPVRAVALQPDGKVIIGGEFSVVNGAIRQRLARVNANGALDTEFNPELGPGGLNALLLQSDGRIVLGGMFTLVGGQVRRGLARILADGQLDTTFQADVTSSVPLAQGIVYCLARQADDAIIVGGVFTTIKGRPWNGVARLSAKGDFDASFLPPFANQAAVSVSGVVVQRDGMLVFGGEFTLPGDFAHSYLIRCKSDGALDPSFAASPDAGIISVAEADGGGYYAVGNFSRIGGGARSRLARVRSDGSLDPGFSLELSGSTLGLASVTNPIVRYSEGQMLFAGGFARIGGVTRNGLARTVPPEPRVVAQPASVAVASGATTTFAVTVAGIPPTYQWRKDGVALAGATNASLTLSGVRPQDAGRYDVTITNSAGTTTSNAATLTVNYAPIIAAQPAAVAVVAGQPASFSVGVSAVPSPTFQWLRDGLSIPGATHAQLAFPAAKVADAGQYQCVVTNEVGVVTTITVALTVTTRAHLANLSVRTLLARGESVVMGFVVAGGTTDMMVRAAGPALQQFGLTTAMADPRLELFRDSTKVLDNDNWPASLAPAFDRVGAFPFVVGSLDAALQQTLGGAYSIVASGSGPGVVLVEAYDLGAGDGPRLVNLSARNRVGTGDDVLIAGFSTSGAGILRVLIRAVGPTMGAAPFNVPGVLADPKLELRNAAGLLITENDNWDPGLTPTFGRVGAFGLGPGAKDAAVLVELAGGNSYTVVVKGADGGTGVALVEIYEVP